jgi:hypothetical protein
LKKLTVNKLVFALAAAALSCSSTSDVNGFPSSYANAYCHFAYHCCTPADRSKFPPGFSNAEASLNFDNEGDCNSKLSDSTQAQFQDVQASVKAKRMTWSSKAAQTCLTALNKATSPCSALAFNTAIYGDPNNPGAPAACDFGQMETGTVGAAGTCTLDQDCANGSRCSIPTRDGGTPIVQSTGTCVPLPDAGSPCAAGGMCATGSCCTFSTGICAALQPTGAACDNFFGPGFLCTAKPCDETADYCHFDAGTGTCQPKLPIGTPCALNSFGAPYADSCQSGNCVAGTCAAVPQTEYNVCTGNSTGY